jgi:hypothetical protein
MTRRVGTAFVALVLLTLCAGQVTDPQQWPGIGNLPGCVDGVFQGCLYDCAYNTLPQDGCIPCGVDCGDWECACSDYGPALSVVNSVASYLCSSNLYAVPSVTSIFNTFCAQLTATPTYATYNPAATGDTSSSAGEDSNPNGGSGSNIGGCIFGENATDDQCNNNSNGLNGKSAGIHLSVPRILLFGCVTVVSGLVLFGRDAACTYGSNAQNNSCNGNVVGVPIKNGTSKDSSSTARDLGIWLGIGTPSFLVSFFRLGHYRKRAREREILFLAAQMGEYGQRY